MREIDNAQRSEGCRYHRCVAGYRRSPRQNRSGIPATIVSQPAITARSNGDYLLLFRLGGAAVTPALAIDLIMALTVVRKTRDGKVIRNH
jgi:hypothetical protein